MSTACLDHLLLSPSTESLHYWAQWTTSIEWLMMELSSPLELMSLFLNKSVTTWCTSWWMGKSPFYGVLWTQKCLNHQLKTIILAALWDIYWMESVSVQAISSISAKSEEYYKHVLCGQGKYWDRCFIFIAIQIAIVLVLLTYAKSGIHTISKNLKHSNPLSL